MAKSLIIVESPAKTKTLKNFLGSDYLVEASMGHVRDLPEHRLGVDVKNDFAPTYQPLPDRGDVLERLAKAAKGVKTVYLASDPDREGEAIAWHLAEALNLKNVKRIQFNEITQTAVQHALENPRTVNMDRVNAQQARRVLDRLIGYKLSPVLSAKIQKGLSAGRVQSVAVRLICEREREIQAFKPEEYWTLTATLTPVAPEKKFLFPARLHSRGGQKLEPKSEDDINIVLADLVGAHYVVGEVKKREQKRNAAAPFITSTLQQEASRKLGFSNKRTMSVAQHLYEGVEVGEHGSVGLITYMRTDSVRVAGEAQAAARQFIAEKYGPAYVPANAKQFKSKGEAQDAHEAVRPTHIDFEPEVIARHLSAEQLKLYRLIWQRFVASQMNPAIMDVTTADIQARGGDKLNAQGYIFRATGTVTKFDGFMRVYTEGKDTEEVTDEEQPPLPPLAAQQPLDLVKLDPRQHFTEPPPRYTEATIVKALEERGIGRPSTYASIISVIRDRKYVELTDKRFLPTELGFKVTDQLVKHFPIVMDIKFTADMENKLDEVAEGREDWIRLLHNFYDPFALSVTTAKVEMENLKPPPVETEYSCPETGKMMLLRQGRFGPFMGCSGYPECKKILKLDAEDKPIEGANFLCGLLDKGEKTPVDPSTLPNATEYVCPNHLGVMLTRQGRFGTFLGCSSYPKCRTVLKTKPDGTLQDGQEFACTYNENAGKKGAKKTAGRATTVRGSKAVPASNGAEDSAAVKPRRAAAKTTTATAAKTTKAAAAKPVKSTTTKTAAAKTTTANATAARTKGTKTAAAKPAVVRATTRKTAATSTAVATLDEE
jgi:DNA topoisomerase-1